VLIAAAIDRCFMAGLAYFLGLSRIGATVIRGGSSSIAVLADLVRYQRPSVLIGVPSLLLTLAERLRADGFDPASAGIKGIVCIGEPVRTSELKLSALGRSLAGNWGARVYGTYASTEMAATFADCPQGCGGHLPAGLLAVEIVDETGRVLSPGQAGEVVATPLQVTGMPLLRFRTGDIATLHDDPCCCGRKTFRLGPVLGRKNQMLKFRGTTLFPPAIFSALQELPGVQGYYLEVFSDFELSDRIRVVVGVGDADIDAATIEEKIVSRTRVKPEVVLAPPAEVQKKTVQESKRKPVTFFDYREQPAT
ncbi:MAG: phenylacetate--CoA ligase, partial [Desulfuromonadales bacterium]|nr:phenylacetate--CoA ligase [Desulfuromonadales bacterium]NIS42257.1 phenylacetate--CoA ligase [Desulfuromonadales bacterium]